MKTYLKIAHFGSTHGLKGELRAQFLGDNLDDFTLYPKFYINEQEVKIEKFRQQKNVVVLKLKGVDDIDAAKKLIGKFLTVNRNDITLPEGRYYVDDLIGLSVIDADSGKIYGKVKEILQNAPTDVYVIESPEKDEKGKPKELLFPAIKDVLIETDLQQGFIKIKPLPGLFEG